MKINRDLLDTHLLYAWRDESHLRSVQRKYVQYFQDAPGPVLDIGCGRGIMLELLETAGVKACGLDLSHESVKICRERGLDAVQGDAVEHLMTLPDHSIGECSALM